MKLKPYPEYKDSGVPWVDKVPSHWKYIRAKWLFRKMQRPVAKSNDVITCFRDGVVTLRKNRRISGFTESLKEIGYQGIRKGDLVIHQMDVFAGAVGVSDSNGKGSPIYSICTPKVELNTYYYAKIIREMARSKFILSLSKGIRERSTDFRFGIFGVQILPFPPLYEQKGIASFVKAKEKKIAQFIRKKRKMIQLLKEQKQAIINQAVTKGINPHVKMKPSGIDWIGDIPKHWSIVPLKRLAKFKGGTGFPHSAQGKQNLDIAFYKVSDMNLVGNHIYMINTNNSITKEVAYELGANIFPRQTIIFPKVGGAMLTNKRRIITKPSCIDNNIMGCIPKKNIFFDFLFLRLQQIDFGLLSKPGPVPAISEGEVREIRIPLPPYEEQLKIVDFILNNIKTIELAIDRMVKELDLIQEYRTRLISDVVTGKIDVRGIEIEDIPEEELTEELKTTEESEVPEENSQEVSNAS